MSGGLMKYRLLDILACPYDKEFPLKLFVLERKEYPKRVLDRKKPLCELYCAYLSKYLKELKSEPPCEECIKWEISEGILYCSKCNRWYPIIEEIPHMLPDKYRKEKEDLSFLEKYKDRLPEYIVKRGKPFNLGD